MNELVQAIYELRVQLNGLIAANKSGQLKSPHQIKKVRREIAQKLTQLHNQEVK